MALGKCLDGFSPSEQLHDSPSLACPCRSAAEPRGSRGSRSRNQRSPGNSRNNPGNPRVLLSLAKSSHLFGIRGVLDVGGQELGDAIAVALAAAWPSLASSLQRLHLGGNNISDEGMVALIAAIEAHGPSPSKLRRLNLRGNNLGPASVEALASLLPLLPKLESLDLGGNALENSTAQFPGLRTWF
ncbi:unnamed protein product [Cladocopium goreaui]|uniref:Protein NLRC3 n=1 Tax=Cladocopium goreaui TaxID=2562237 RepID=A0A9P1BP64_9DINO|nr:unnamed protein product [Cladocopium goreaui]